MNDVAQDWLRKDVKLQSGGSGQIRIFEVARGSTQKVFAGTELVRDISDSTELYAEEVPVDEARAADDESVRVVPVFHYNKEPNRTHGIPFQFVLLPVGLLTTLLGLSADLFPLRSLAGREVRRDQEAATDSDGHERQGHVQDEVLDDSERAVHQAEPFEGR